MADDWLRRQKLIIRMSTQVYLIPSVLDEMAVQTIPFYIVDAIKDCQVIFAENERTAHGVF